MSDGFIKVARVEDIAPGKMTTVQAHGSTVLIANVDGTFYAIDDTCTHEDASLCMGALHGSYVRCPLHGSRFDLASGQPLEEPAEEPVRTYPVRVDGDDLWLGPARG
jgi:3-phenylpropionate/trans-cinnamate dioxygenase ferredoxin subunit